MREFFLDENVIYPFKLFGIVHIGCILLAVIGLFIVYRKREYIKKIPIKYHKVIKRTFFWILSLNMIIYYASKVYYGVYNWKVHLPFHICFISGILFMIYLLKPNRKFFKIIFPLIFIGPLPAIFYPELSSTFDFFVFYQYFISHHIFMIFGLFIFYLDNYKVYFEDLIKSLILGNGIFISMTIFNKIFDTNYIMSTTLPDHVLDRYPHLAVIWPPLLLETVAILVLFILYKVFYTKKE